MPGKMETLPETPEATDHFQFQGRVVPMDRKINVSQKINVALDMEGKSSIRFQIKIEDSIVIVDCSSAPPMTNAIFSDAYFHAIDLCHNIVDLICFRYGIGLTVVLENWTDPLGNTKPIKSDEPAVAGIVTWLDPKVNIEAAFTLLMAEPPVWEALHDLTQALSHRRNTVINCARAIDSLKYLVSPGATPDKAWENLRDVLNMDQPYSEAISKASRGPRHGNRGIISAEVQTLVIQRSWTIMSRYLEYRLRNSGPLRDPDFPLLTG